MNVYDYIIVGSGLYGATTAWRANKLGLRVLVLEKRPFIGGNIRDKIIEGINVHLYGPHIFHTKDEAIWNFTKKFVHFNHFRYCPLAQYKDFLYNLPFNMHTFYQLYGTKNPDEAISYLKHTRAEKSFTNPKNLEEKAISMVGYKMYETLIKGYTEKQWGRKATELPPFIIERLPLRFTFDNNYFTDPYQGIPKEGYSYLIEKMLEGIEVKNNTDLLNEKSYWLNMAKKIIYTGSIDEFFDYCFGALEYRSLRFEHKLYEQQNVQGCAVINETDIEVPYTRSIEHKHFVFGEQPVSIVTREYPQVWEKGCEAFYPINDERNTKRYTKYINLANQECPNIIFGGRLGQYRYLNMDEVIKSAFKLKLYS